MLTFEKDPFQGTQSILEKLTVSWRRKQMTNGLSLPASLN